MAEGTSTSTPNTRMTTTSPTATAPNHISSLRLTTHAFCKALLNPPAPADLLKTHFTSDPQITEHGPEWARTRLSFLAHTFTGVDGCCEYFTLLDETLEMNMSSSTFPGPEGFIVDAGSVIGGQGEDGSAATGAVSVVGKAEFKAKATGKSWKEQFIYRFSGFDEEGKFGHWEIWADPLSAWMAVGPGEGFKQSDYL